MNKSHGDRATEALVTITPLKPGTPAELEDLLCVLEIMVAAALDTLLPESHSEVLEDFSLRVLGRIAAKMEQKQ